MRFGSRLWLVSLLVACAPTAVVPAPATPRPSSPGAEQSSGFDTPRPSGQYRRVPNLKRRGAVDELEPQFQLVSGRRMQERSGSYELADTVAASPLQGFARAPGFAGGGFVFWSAQGLYRSATFLGRLKPLAATAFAVSRVAFGPGYLVAISSNGQRRVFDAQTGLARAPFPLGLVDVAAAADGRVVAVLELGRAVVSLDRGATFREVQQELAGAVTALSAEPLGFVVGSNLFSLSGNGQLSQSALLKSKPIKDPRWPGNETPLERAVLQGVPRGAGHALVAASAALAEVDLQSGELVSVGPQLLPGNPDCQLFEQGVELLMRCQAQATLSIVAQVDTSHPLVERTFSGRPQLVEGFGQLLVGSDCDDSSRPFAVCVRTAGGVWRSVARAAEPPPDPLKPPPGAPAQPPTVRSYALCASGSVVAFVDGEKDGYLDLKTGKFVVLDKEFQRVIEQQSSCLVEVSGALRCLTRSGPVSFSPEGKLEPSPFSFIWSATAGARALGIGEGQHLFQSEDTGRTWREVGAPPLFDRSFDSSSRCSAVGCKVGPWLRLGWEARPASATAEPEAIDLPRAISAPRPVLACGAQQPPVTAVSPAFANEGTEHSQRSSGLGSESVPAAYFRMPIEADSPNQPSLGSMALRGVVSGLQNTQPDATSYLSSGRPLAFRFVDYFDAKAKKQSSSLPLGELFRAARDAGNAPPTLDFEDQSSFQAVAVLGREPGKTAGFILSHETNQLWLSGARVSAFAHETTETTWSPLAAAVEKDGALLQLMDDGSDRHRVTRMTNGAVTQIFELPIDSLSMTATPDTLGLADNGEIAVLRFSSGTLPPTSEYPVLAFRPGKAIEVLAPWSSLRAGSDPACSAGGGYRAVLTPVESWLELTRGAPLAAEDSAMTAIVRWSKERVCLEAVELNDAPFTIAEQDLLTRVSASFVPKPEAARLGFALGFELRQPLTCELRASAR